jgi:glycosyltransferase involved in cell wall biosynthesis
VRIAQVAPLFESVPPHGYGGTERVVSYLTEELVRAGHEVTLFASADSRTAATLIPGVPLSIRANPHGQDALSAHLVMLEQVAQRAAGFDVIHAHLDHLPFSLARRSHTPWITTLHGRLDLDYLAPVFQEFREQHVVSISDAQRDPLPWLRWAATVYHGLPRDLYRFHARSDDYLVFVGRISEEKRVDRAVEIAIRNRRKLRIAAKIDDADADYYRHIQRKLRHPLVEFVGEVGDQEKDELLGNAAALLFPIDWPEPFGLVMIEALACGTPVIAWRHGSVEEIIQDGSTGFLCQDVGQAARAVAELSRLDRAACRRAFEERFTADRMAAQYVEVYEWICKNSLRAA